MSDYEAHLNKFQAGVDQALLELTSDHVIRRIWEHDHTVWRNDPTEIANRLGWLHSYGIMADAVDDIRTFVSDVRKDGFTHVLLFGMGGSSLAPEVFRHTFCVEDGYLNLRVLDSTDPGAVLNELNRIEFNNTLFIVSTKSGGTIETISLLKVFYNHAINVLGDEGAGKHFAAITDPESNLVSVAETLKFRKVFINDPNIGGRFSVLSFFGLVPAALMGIDIHLALQRAAKMAVRAGAVNSVKTEDNPAARLGVAMGQMARMGKDKITLIISPDLVHFGVWVEQLIAESTGKEGRGILPVVGEALSEPDRYAADRLFINIRLKNDDTHDDFIHLMIQNGHPAIRLSIADLYDLFGEFFRWEMAAAVAGRILGINPFDQPNVESEKILARNMMAAYEKTGKLPESSPTSICNEIDVYSDVTGESTGEYLMNFFRQAVPGINEMSGRSYVAIQAYVAPTLETDAALNDLRTKIQKRWRMAVTVGYGPRFLHSTGQLHKGDAGNGLFVQLTAEMPEDLPIPDTPRSNTSTISFGILKTAQALGDRRALLDAGRKVIRFHLGGDVAGDIKKLAAFL